MKAMHTLKTTKEEKNKAQTETLGTKIMYNSLIYIVDFKKNTYIYNTQKKRKLFQWSECTGAERGCLTCLNIIFF